MSGLRIGIDVGGTNTDAVLVDDSDAVLAAVKTPTTPDPFDGVQSVISQLLDGVDKASVSQAMLGTTHPANAIIERRGLGSVGVLRAAAPSSLAVRPGASWPADLHANVIGPSAIVGGGFEFDGTEIARLDDDAIKAFGAECVAQNVSAIAVASAFAPINNEHELRAVELLRAEVGPDLPISMSHQVGSIGLLQRENATVLNASLLGVARGVVEGFRAALASHGLDVDAYLAQNDGTLMAAEEALDFPIMTLGSGLTNSMRGACALAGLTDAVVVDVGGTSADTGILVGGFPRESGADVEIGGVRTNFRMPDLVSIGLGGGSIVRPAGGSLSVGPESVGYRVTSEALVTGGRTLTLSDVSVAAGRLVGFGDASLVADLDPAVVKAALEWVDAQFVQMADRIKASGSKLPLIAVGGGSHLVPDTLAGVSEVVRPSHHAVANAFGASIAEASGSVDRIYRFEARGRETCIDEAKQIAVDGAIRAGADPTRVRISSVSEIPLSYLPGRSCRVQVKAAGPLLA